MAYHIEHTRSINFEIVPANSAHMRLPLCLAPQVCQVVQQVPRTFRSHPLPWRARGEAFPKEEHHSGSSVQR